MAYVVLLFCEDDLSRFPQAGDVVLLFTAVNSESMAGLDIFFLRKSISPVSNFNKVDMAGRLFGMSWVHKRPIFKYLQASSISKSPSSVMSTN